MRVLVALLDCRLSADVDAAASAAGGQELTGTAARVSETTLRLPRPANGTSTTAAAGRAVNQVKSGSMLLPLKADDHRLWDGHFDSFALKCILVDSCSLCFIVEPCRRWDERRDAKSSYCTNVSEAACGYCCHAVTDLDCLVSDTHAELRK